MKKTLLSVIVLFTLILGFNNSAYSVEQGYISVNTSSEIELVPDTIDFSVEITTTSKESMAKAISENKVVSGKVYEDLKKSIDISKGDSIKTSNYSANPVYRYNNNKRVLDYYQVTNNIKIHTKKVAEAGKMIDKSTTNGATSVNNISYSVSKYEDECTKLLADASKKAKEQANSIASSLGTEITGIKSIEGNCSISSNNTMPRMMLMSKAVGAALNDTAEENFSTTIEVGTMKLYARINAYFYIK